MNVFLDQVLESLNVGSLEMITKENMATMSNIALEYIENPQENLADMVKLVKISNILYNNTDFGVLPLEDSIYDQLVNLLLKYTGSYPIGAAPINFKVRNEETALKKKENTVNGKIKVLSFVNPEQMFFKNITSNEYPYLHRDFLVERPLVDIIKPSGDSVAHKYPELVGTIDKCQFTTIAEVVEKNQELIYDDKTKIFERDWLNKIFARYDNGMSSTELGFCLSLKYDGISIEAEIEDGIILSARTRGDTENDEAQDMTHIFGGYAFARANGIKGRFGMVFECIITDYMLSLLEENEGITYNNKRTAVIGLTGRDDGRAYRDYLTLVPIRTAGIPELNTGTMSDRLLEIEFMNRYFSSGVEYRYTIIQGNKMEILYQVYNFVKTAENIRPRVPFMYDGIVVELIDPKLKKDLGRYRSVNRWSIAIKFQAMKVLSFITGLKFTVGQDGRITPMAYFKPVSFFGGIHDHVSMHSYNRLLKIGGLKEGEIVELEYRNDVMPYLNKVDCEENRNNTNPVLPMPTHCPFCGAELVESKSGKIIRCPNDRCPERIVTKMTNMLKKLNFKDFSEQYVRILGFKSFCELMEYDYDTAIDRLGAVMGAKFMERINELKTKEIYDYRLADSLGIDGVGSVKWESAFMVIPLEKMLRMQYDILFLKLRDVKGIGRRIASKIISALAIYRNEFEYINSMDNVLISNADPCKRISIRFTGCRDKDLCEFLMSLGMDASAEKSVTKQTDILIVPYDGFESSKTRKLGKIGKITTLSEMIEWARKQGYEK